VPELATPLLPGRPWVFQPGWKRGSLRGQDPPAGHYYTVGEEEHFLLTQLDGEQNAEAIRAAFSQRFGQPLDDEELGEFLGVARDQGLLQTRRAGDTDDAVSQSSQPDHTREEFSGTKPRRVSWQGLLSWRINLFDPTGSYLGSAEAVSSGPVLSSSFGGSIVLAAALVGLNREQLAFVSAAVGDGGPRLADAHGGDHTARVRYG
jgi:hypothetical protein